MKKKLFAVSVACGLSFNLAAQAPSETNVLFGAPVSLVIEQSAPAEGDGWASYNAVLMAHFQRVQRHGRWT